MFRTLIYPSSGACDYSVELPHCSYYSWFDVCWSFGVVGLEWYPCCRPSLQHGYHSNPTTPKPYLHLFKCLYSVHRYFIFLEPKLDASIFKIRSNGQVTIQSDKRTQNPLTWNSNAASWPFSEHPVGWCQNNLGQMHGFTVQVLIVFFTTLTHKFFILIHSLHSFTCFEQHCAHVQEANCISAASGIITLFRWLFSTQVTRGLQSSRNPWSEQSPKESDDTRCCTNTIVLLNMSTIVLETYRGV